MNAYIRMDTPKVGKGEPEPSYGDALLDAAEVRMDRLTGYRGQSTITRTVWRPDASGVYRWLHDFSWVVTTMFWLIAGACLAFVAVGHGRGADIAGGVGAIIVVGGWIWWTASVPERLLVTLRSPDTLGVWETVEHARLAAAASSSPAAKALRGPLRGLHAEALRALTIMEDTRQAYDTLNSNPYRLPAVATGQDTPRHQEVIDDAWRTALYAATIALAATWVIKSGATLGEVTTPADTSPVTRVEDLVLSARKP